MVAIGNRTQNVDLVMPSSSAADDNPNEVVTMYALLRGHVLNDANFVRSGTDRSTSDAAGDTKTTSARQQLPACLPLASGTFGKFFDNCWSASW